MAIVMGFGILMIWTFSFQKSHSELPRKERLFWSSGKESAKKIVEAGLQTALYHALTSLQQYHADHYGFVEEDEDIEDQVKKQLFVLQIVFKYGKVEIGKRFFAG